MEGYIKVYRSLFYHWIWEEKPYSKGQAWLDLLQLANIRDSKTLVKGKVYEVKKGQVFRAINTLAERWGWSRKKVVGFLALLEREKMATSEGTSGGTLITIENYTFYSTLGAENGTSEGTSKGHQGDTKGTRNKKEKKKERNNNKGETLSDWIDDIVPETLRPSFLEWADMRKAIKKPVLSRATVQRAFNTLTKLSTNESVQIRIIEQSVDRCWASFYELKEKEQAPRYKDFEKDDDTDKDFVPMSEEQKKELYERMNNVI